MRESSRTRPPLPPGGPCFVLRLSPAFAGPHHASQLALDVGDELFRSQRAADEFAATKRGEGGIVRIRVEEIGEVRGASQQRTDVDKAVAAAGQVSAHAGMRPIRSLRDKPARTGLSATYRAASIR